MQTELLKTKLFIPPSRPGLVLRQRLLDQLEAGLQRGQPLTLVSAPPGFGKTTLIAAWIASQNQKSKNENRKYCWLSLDETENDPSRFWRYLIAALQTAEPELGSAALAALQSPQPPAIVNILGELINELAGLRFRLVLVLDDFHQLHNAEIGEAFNFFLDHLPPQLHLVICTRSDPPIALSRRRGRGDLNEVRAAELRFTSPETADFFNDCMKLGLASGDLAALEARTEGWAVGMQMAALSLQGVTDKHAVVAAFSGDDRYIADYLVDEVLNRQPPHVRQFLLSTSLLERLCAPLCDAVLGPGEKEGAESLPAGGSQAILDGLERANLFVIPLDNHRQWFRYHHLFAQLLRQKLEQEAGRALTLILQDRASLWYASNGFTLEAIRLSMAVGNFEDAARLLDGYADQMFILSELTTLVDWARALPEEVLARHPRALLGAAWAAHASVYLQDVSRLLRLAEGAAGASVESHLSQQDRLAELEPLPRAILVEAAVIYARLYLDAADPQVGIRLCQNVLPYLTPERDSEPVAFNLPSHLRPAVLVQLALADELGGRLDEACAGFRAAVPESKENMHLVALSIGHLAGIEYHRGNREAARQACRWGLEILGRFKVPPTAFFGLVYVVDGLLALDSGDLEQAAEQLQSGIDLGRPWNLWDALIPGYTGLARLRQAQGDRPAAQAALDDLAALGVGNPQARAAVDAARAELDSAPDVVPSPVPSLSHPARTLQPGLIEPLSERELEVLALISQGASNAEIANKLVVTVNTVKKHVTNIYGKLGVASRVQAVEAARRLKII